jgi:integrase
LGSFSIKEHCAPKVFSVASKNWLEASKTNWIASNYRIESINLGHLAPHFGRKLLVDISGDDISRYQAVRKEEGASPRTVNMEIGTLRAILRKHRAWANIQPDVRMLKTRGEIGRALSADEQHRLLTACKKVRSRSLYPAVLLSLHTGLRNAELRLLRWRLIDFLEKQLVVGKSKTAGGEGRVIPLSETAFNVLQEWRREFPDASPSHYVFPTERYGLAGEDGYLEGKVVPYAIDPTKPIGSWKVAWTAARTAARVDFRWPDMRHTFVSRLAESQASTSPIISLSVHLSRKMMERYSHTRAEAKRSAIEVFDHSAT